MARSCHVSYLPPHPQNIIYLALFCYRHLNVDVIEATHFAQVPPYPTVAHVCHVVAVLHQPVFVLLMTSTVFCSCFGRLLHAEAYEEEGMLTHFLYGYCLFN